MTDEELRDEMLALYEEKESLLASQEQAVITIEQGAMERFDKGVIEIKNRIVADTTISDEELEKKYLEEIESLRKQILEGVNQEINKIIEVSKGTSSI